MRVEVTGLDSIIKKLRDIPDSIEISERKAIAEASAYIIEQLKISLQSRVYDRTDGPYAFRERGPFADPLLYDLLDDAAFQADIGGLAATIMHESKSGIIMETGSIDHEVSAINNKYMVWQDAFEGDFRYSEEHKIKGVQATHWFELGVAAAMPGVLQIFGREVWLGLRVVAKYSGEY